MYNKDKIKERKGENKMLNKTLVFDMDGTIADLYGVMGWLDDIHAENPRPYAIAEPMYDMEILNGTLNLLKANGWRIVVTTWLAKGSTKHYDNLVRMAKLEWLEMHNFPFDEVHMVKYGTTKANCTRKLGGFQILFDDNEAIRKGWNLGATVDANENILEILVKLLDN